MSVLGRAQLYLGVSGLALLSAQAGYAQNAMAVAEAAPEQVLITGSLLGAANFAAPTPVTQVTAVQVETRSLTGIGTLIEELPYAQTGQGLTRNTNGIVAAAQSLPNLRGLGANDTLVLIDGQRPTPVNPTNNFDTDMIPASLLDRFEVVTTGASASYGSDAVAGVVNFILKDHLQGFNGNVQYGTSQRGDEDQMIASGAYGTAFAGGKAHFIIGGEFAKQYRTVNFYARSWGRLEPNLVPLPANRAAGLPANLLTEHAEVDNGSEGGLITGCAPATVPCPIGAAPSATAVAVSFDKNGQPYNFPFGTLVGGSFMVGTGNYGVSSMNRQLSPPYQRWAGLARFEYDITPDINAYAMINYGQLESNDPSGGSPFPVVLKVFSGNPYIPPTIQAVMTANKITSITLAKENLDGLGTGNTADNKNTLLQSFFGVRGSIFGDWNWDVQGSDGRAVVWQAFSNVPLVANLDAAANVVKDANGTPVCGPLATNPIPFTNPTLTPAQIAAQAAPGCQPYNPFGVPSAASVAYITNSPLLPGVDGSKANIRQYMFNADLRGAPYDLPAGPIDVAIGANYRHNSYAQLGSPPAQAGLYQTRNPSTFFIDQNTWETFGEVGVPVVKDLPFAKSVDLNAAVRYTDYSITGGVTTWKYGATWDINDMVRLRATRSQDIRAPNFTELNPLPTSSATNLQNPISGISQRVSNIQTTGNPNLMPEVAQNFTAGIVFQPTFDWLSGFRASADYYRIRISGQIAAVGAQDVINRCLNLKLQDFCDQLTFSGTDIKTTFGISNIHLFSVNLNAEIQDGWDFNISERFTLQSLGVPGSFDFSALGSYINQQRTLQSQSDGSIISTNAADTTTAPRWAWNVNFSYILDRLTTNLQMRYYSPIKYSTTNIGPDDRNYSPTNPVSINQNIWPAAITWNLHVSYDVIQEPDGQDLQVYFNVDNLFDKDPPIIWWFVSNYDVVGRFFKVGIRYTMP